ncbi:hypothetical protein GTP45_15600 [Pseudoduganella sp. FT55W]|uniref:Uncharacterized protein n=1 Tax=Duganella rivi TaxID=2666083 RepID=A0A7X4KCI7_9BURK|nr:hypothetical protein [Duganella rivi]MYM68245.1 hypothetical protein [Duganella rivi]
MDDLIKTVKAQLYDRLGSPLIFSFSISWILWNYRMIVILTSSLSPSDKFLAIDLLGLIWESSTWFWAVHLGVGPLATSAAYIFVYPFIEKGIFEFTLNKRKELKQVRQRIEDETPVTEEEAKELRGLSNDLYREHRAILKDRDEEIAKLKVSIRELKDEIENQTKTQQTMPLPKKDPLPELEPSQERLLATIGKISTESEFASFEELLKESENSNIKVQYDIDVLERHRYIQDYHGGGTGYILSAKGRAYCIENLSDKLLES